MAGSSVGKARTWCSRVNLHVYKNGSGTRRLSGGSGDRLQEVLFDLCRRRHFITGDKLTEGSLLRGSHGLGPLGKELQKNLVNGWWDSVVLRRDDVLAIDSPHHVPPQTTSGTPLKTIWGDSRRSRLQTGDLTKERPVPSLLDRESPRWTLRGDLLYGALQQYVPCLELMSKRLPFGVAEIGKCFHPIPGETDSAELSGIGERTAASLTWFSAAKTAGRWRDYWLRQRLLWWQKFAQSPSRFSAMEQPEGHSRTTRIYYHFPWGKEPIESVCSMDDSALLQMHPGSTKLHGRDGRKSVTPHVVWVSGDLERGVLACLSDALQPAENLSPQSKDRRREVGCCVVTCVWQRPPAGPETSSFVGTG
ncbi:DNA polymerase subunit gamma-2, mitochondrial isoform X2 [Spea bombifrons]|uniref:DNA polymerase subunit gamma-2, mitochondrial isoform X2 n=1 Tax=Spea bombifrons TaxID=233779 RepID=UPI00234AF663|nr:DNA polymerase subunit gamma-2, mitochondrial isoform X2 [Spea bombifrons]